MSDLTVLSLAAKQITVVESKAGRQGPMGPRGLQGLPGISPSGADLHATHTQSVAASFWAVSHGLGKKPAVTVVDSAGDQVEGRVTYLDLNHLSIEFSAAFAGEAFLN